MRSKKITAILVVLTVVLFSCNNSNTKEADSKKEPTADTVKTAIADKPSADTSTSKENILTITAMFVDFSLGDAPHYNFKDKLGKEWDFADNKDTLHKFSVELPKNKANETNQGWGSDKASQGKWFNIKYVYRNQPQYQDGPMAWVPVILEAKLSE